MLLGLFDRIVFTCGVVVFLQLPAFIDQYTHRLGGFHRAQQAQIANFQDIANNNYAGDLDKLVTDFAASDKPSIRDTAKNIQSSRNNAEAIQSELNVLETHSLTQKLFFLVTNLRYPLANDTLKQFNPSIPLNVQSLLYGLIGGILASLLFFVFIRFPVQWLSSRFAKRTPVINDR